MGSAEGLGDIWSGYSVDWFGRMISVPQPFPKEFRDDVVRVAQNRGPGATRDQTARDSIYG